MKKPKFTCDCFAANSFHVHEVFPHDPLSLLPYSLAVANEKLVIGDGQGIVGYLAADVVCQLLNLPVMRMRNKLCITY